ncbi:ABC transporter ATP-binding protein [Streptomyces lanatus]|uniref:ABC transporter ATP-binding protein n=1 Tax=Streptomyces lanatus TaxID=66900 RepID=A0ABV1XX90_9ACTN|nr:ABC transporter ATP-binding protein [Streptomyces lanatus]GHH17249.1 multidrug ABC transporter ATP-binding protein [Streptomyces lanatus]
MTAREEAVLDVEGLRMRYGSTEVLRDVTLRVHHGEVVCLLGPNGAGKTTTLEILEGFRMRSAGRVEVLGTDPAHADERWRARIGVVLQSWRDHGRWRVRELLTHLGRYYAPYSSGEISRPWDADELIAAVGLTPHAQKKVRMLSGGQRRRLDVAIGLVGRPELLFLDEPTAGLDPVARREFHELVEGLAAQRHTTIVLTTHDLSEAEKLANRIMVLDGGRIIADGTAADLARRIAGEDQVRWTLEGRRHEHTTTESTRFVRELFERHGDGISDLEVRRASLEDTYLTLVRRAESGESTDAHAAESDNESYEVVR